jgi:hypothetical protein
MKFSRALLFLIAVIMIAAFVACGGGSGHTPPPVVPPSPLADGTYVFSLAGQDSATSGFPYYVAGAFKVQGGTITGGEQDFVDFNVFTLQDTITGGSVTTTADGNLKITLTTGDNSVGVGGVETLHGTLVSSSKALITEFDASATSSGELNLQTSTATGQGGYAFFVTGVDSFEARVVIGGVVNVDGAGTISGSGSVIDINNMGNVLQNQPIDPSTVSAPDAFGRVQVSLDLTTSGIGGIGLVGYVVDGNRIRFVENSNDPNDTLFGVTGGTAFAQGANTGVFSAASIAGSSFVVGTTGLDPNGFFQAAGVFTTNVDLTTVSGTLNFNDLTGIGAQAPLPFVGTYTVDATGRVTVQDTTDGFTLEMYLDGNGNGTVASMDNSDVLAGQAYLQTGGGSFNAASFSGSYGLDATGTDLNLLQVDSVGPVDADGIGALSGIVDQNSLSAGPIAGLTLTGDFVADPSGVFTTNAGITGLDVLNPANQGAFSYYLIDNQRAVAIETDPNQLTLGYFELVH